MQLHRPDIQTQFAALDAEILIVSFAPLESLKKWVPFFHKQYVEPLFKTLKTLRTPGFDGQNLAGPESFFRRTRFLADPELQVYRAYGLGRHSAWKAYGPKIVRQYLKFIAQGKPLRLPRADTLQKGGDFVVNQQMRLTLSHTGNDQSERPAVADIVTALGKP